MRYFLWFAIVLMNILFGLGALFFWVNCTPIEKAWKPFAAGTCWDPWISINFGIFVSGELIFLSRCLSASSILRL